jgi:hypothetical protein
MHSDVLYSVFKHSMIVEEFGCCSLRALKTMQEGIHADHAQFALLQASLEKALNRLKVGNKYRRLP